MFGKKQNLSLERLSDGIEKNTLFLWHSLDLLCTSDMVPPKAIVSSLSKIKEHYELSAYQCSGYKGCINIYLKTKKQSKKPESKVKFSLCMLLPREELKNKLHVIDANHAAYFWQAYRLSRDLYRTNFTFITSNKRWGIICFLLLLLLQNISISVITAMVSSSHSQISKVHFNQSEHCFQFQGREVEGGQREVVRSKENLPVWRSQE